MATVSKTANIPTVTKDTLVLYHTPAAIGDISFRKLVLHLPKVGVWYVSGRLYSGLGRIFVYGDGYLPYEELPEDQKNSLHFNYLRPAGVIFFALYFAVFAMYFKAQAFDQPSETDMGRIPNKHPRCAKCTKITQATDIQKSPGGGEERLCEICSWKEQRKLTRQEVQKF
jgi:hypothetical protein